MHALCRTCRIESLEEDKDRNGEIVVKVCTNAFDNEEKWEAIYCRGDEDHPVDRYYRVEQKADIKKKEVGALRQSSALCRPADDPLTLCKDCMISTLMAP